MVFYFTSTVVDPPAMIYMGRDKHENEELIKYGFPEDVWFHVDKLSSAHVYIRLREGEGLDDISAELLNDCAELVKANSIQGNKENHVPVVYTMWSNLKKTGDMAIGQVSFHNEKNVRKTVVEKRTNAIINRLNKTKSDDETPDFAALRQARDRKEQEKLKEIKKKAIAEEKNLAIKRREEAELLSYSSIMTEENMRSNTYREGCSVQDIEDDFM